MPVLFFSETDKVNAQPVREIHKKFYMEMK